MTFPRQQVRLQPSYILHGRPYRDSSLLLEVFTAEHGRVSLVAKGAKRKSKKGSSSALLQPFIPLLLSFTGRSELMTLTATEAAGSAWPLRGERIFSGLYLNELLTRLLHRDDPHPQIFAAYGDVLAALAGPGAPDSPLRRFELTLLSELGYDVDLTHDCASGEPVKLQGRYRYRSGEGLEAVDDRHDASEATFLGADLLAMAEGDFEGVRRLLAKHLLRAVLADHLGDQPLRSRELFQARSGAAPSGPEV